MSGITIVIMLCGATIAAAIASGKQRNVAGWLIAGALFPLISILIVGCLPSLAPAPPVPRLE